MNKNKWLGVFFINALLVLHSYAMEHNKIDDLAHDFMKKNKVPGLSIAVINKGTTHFFNYGYSDEHKKLAVTKDTIYTIASFTKTVTATLAAIAAVEHRLDLDAPFNKYMPELNNKNLNNISSSQLLGHVSSFPFDFTPRPQTHTELIKDLNQFKEPRAPGSEYSYSNAGIGTVGYVLQHVYRMKYERILKTKLLAPLNMNSTYLRVPQEKAKNIALGHNPDDSPVVYSAKIEPWFAAASLKSTITDMAQYLKAHMNYKSLHDTTIAKAIPLVHKNKYCFDDQLSCEQLAWQAHVISELNQATGDSLFIDFAPNGTPVFGTKKIIGTDTLAKKKIFIDKTGGGYGMFSYMLYIPEEHVGVVLLLNKLIGDERIKLGRDIVNNIRAN